MVWVFICRFYVIIGKDVFDNSIKIAKYLHFTFGEKEKGRRIIQKEKKRMKKYPEHFIQCQQRYKIVFSKCKRSGKEKVLGSNANAKARKWSVCVEKLQFGQFLIDFPVYITWRIWSNPSFPYWLCETDTNTQSHTYIHTFKWMKKKESLIHFIYVAPLKTTIEERSSRKEKNIQTKFLSLWKPILFQFLFLFLLV